MTDGRAADHLEHAARLERAQRALSAQASALLVEFAEEAQRLGISVTRLDARSSSGRGRLRTQVDGWYLKRDHSLGVGVDGAFYVLHVPSSLSARLRGVILEPSDPPLELGKGARDGESMPIQRAIAQRLAAGNDF